VTTTPTQPGSDASGDEQRAITQRLSRLQGPGELRAALLALVRTPGSGRELQAWREHTQGVATADAIRNDIRALGADARLPWFEVLCDRLKRRSAAEHHSLVEAARKVMAADGKVRPQDRLLWLALRHRLGEGSAMHNVSGPSDNDLTKVSAEDAQAIASFTAYLARLVPEPSDEMGVGLTGQRWYIGVVKRCLAPDRQPPCNPPDTDTMVRSLRQLQELPWMLRPLLARAWVEVALLAGANTRLHDSAADALRLSCRLLESPMPPALVGRYIELDIRP
jgi:hypothetical protein